MESHEGSNRLIEAFHQKIDYFRKEYDISYAELIGVLRIVSREVEDELLEVERAEQEGEADGA